MLQAAAGLRDQRDARLLNGMRRRRRPCSILVGALDDRRCRPCRGDFPSAVYNGTKAFLDSYSYALRDELKDGGRSPSPA
jgi:hypothetical protein